MNDGGNNNKPTGLNVAYESFDPLTGVFDQDTFLKSLACLSMGKATAITYFLF